MPEIKAYRCDSCNRLIEQEIDVYRLELAGAEWIQGCPAGGHSETMQNIKKIGLCEMCARKVVFALEKIAEVGLIFCPNPIPIPTKNPYQKEKEMVQNFEQMTRCKVSA